MVIVHCFRCDDVVEAATDVDGPLWCSQCDDEVLGPPSDTGDRSMRWSTSGLLLAGQEPEAPRRWVPRTRGGSMMGAAMLGMYQAIYGPIDDEIAIEVVDDEPESDDDVELHLDREVRSRSWIRFKGS